MRRQRSWTLLSVLLVLTLILVQTAAAAAPPQAQDGPLSALAGQRPEQVIDTAPSGPHAAGYTLVTASRPDGSTFEAWLFYPATEAGQDAPYDDSEAPYPAISFGHGFLAPPMVYKGNFEHLTSWGYFVIATRSGGGFFPSIPDYAADLSHCLTFLEEINGRPDSRFYQQIDTDKFGLSGHSMGGGASILATAADPRVKALINLAAAETWPDSAIEAMQEVTVPVALVAGSEDRLTPVDTNVRPMYENGQAPRYLPILQGADHCGFGSELAFCSTGSMGFERQIDITYRWLAAFFNLYLKGQVYNGWNVWGPGVTLDRFVETELDVGFTVAPLYQSQSGGPGQTITYELTLTNEGPHTTSYTLQSLLNRWPVTLIPQQTDVLAPGDSAVIAVQVAIPATPPRLRDSALIIALSDQDGLSGQYSLLASKIATP